MTVAYLDASAAAKLFVEEPESSGLRRYLSGAVGRTSSALLRAELIRVASRYDTKRVGEARIVLGRITLREIDNEVLDRAGELAPKTLRTLDAIHLATASLLGSELEAVVTYDRRMIEAAQVYGLPVASPA